MLHRIFPKIIDNRFRGLPIALWLFVPLLLLRLVIGTNSMINTADVASNADGIPLTQYGPDAAAQIVQLFALVGLATFASGLLSVVALFRYRALIPLLYLVMLIQQIGGRILLAVHPTVRAGAVIVGSSGISAGTIVSYTLTTLIVLGFVLSLFGRRYGEAA